MWFGRALAFYGRQAEEAASPRSYWPAGGVGCGEVCAIPRRHVADASATLLGLSYALQSSPRNQSPKYNITIQIINAAHSLREVPKNNSNMECTCTNTALLNVFPNLKSIPLV